MYLQKKITISANNDNLKLNHVATALRSTVVLTEHIVRSPLHRHRPHLHLPSY